MPVEIASEDGILKAGGHRLHLKGVNWFGFETPNFTLHGLWCRKLSSLLDFVAANGFNAIRVPFSAELALHMDERSGDNINYGENPDLEGLTSGQVMDVLIREAAARGLLILLDLHHLTAASGITELWYNEDVDEATYIRAWETVVLRYKDSWNVMGADLNNEPHGRATWGDGCAETDWREAAQRIGNAILAINPRLLIFVEGTSGNCCPVQTPEACWWGGALCSAAAAPVSLDIPSRLVYSPHVYGPGVHEQEYFKGDCFPGNMPDIWERQWAHLRLSDSGGPAVVPGEWGGRMAEGSKERRWAEAFVEFQRASGITDSFFWCLNPNSGDTVGLLEDDWSQPVQYKLDLLARANPDPTRFTPEGDIAHPGGGDAYSADPLPPRLPQPTPPPTSEPVPQNGNSTPSVPSSEPLAPNGKTASGAPTPASALAEGRTPGELESVVGMTHIVRDEEHGVEVSVTVTKAWANGPAALYQMDIAVKNMGTLPLADVNLSWPASCEQQVWSLTEGAVGMDGRKGYSMPEWVVKYGGLKPGEPLMCGGIFIDAPQLDLRVDCVTP